MGSMGNMEFDKGGATKMKRGQARCSRALRLSGGPQNAILRYGDYKSALLGDGAVEATGVVGDAVRDDFHRAIAGEGLKRLPLAGRKVGAILDGVLAARLRGQIQQHGGA